MQVETRRRAPKNWNPPQTGNADRQLIDLARGRLRDSGYLALDGVHCDYRKGSLIVSGNVPSFYLKQVVYVLLKDLEGPTRYVDQLTVGSHDPA